MKDAAFRGYSKAKKPGICLLTVLQERTYSGAGVSDAASLRSGT